jgi:hypothetical protein
LRARIKDASGFALAYVYARSDPALQGQVPDARWALVIAEPIRQAAGECE